MTSTPPHRLTDQYELLELVGGGAWTEVHRARRRADNLPVAIKRMPAEIAAQPLAAGRFDREVEISSTVQHPFVVRALDHGTDADGSLYLVMEWLEGQSLRQRLDESSSLEPADTMRVAMQLTNALVETHASGWIHRDLTPSNVFQCADRRIVLFDYGMAGHAGARSGRRLTRVGMSVGTLHYMAPEQIGGEACPASDLFSLGVILYECLTGAHPWPASQPAAYVMSVQSNDAAPLVSDPRCVRAPLALCALVDQLVRRAASDRPANATDVMAELARIASRA